MEAASKDSVFGTAFLTFFFFNELGCKITELRYDPLVSEEPAFVCTMAASVQQLIAFGERAGQQVRRLGAGLKLVLKAAKTRRSRP